MDTIATFVTMSRELSMTMWVFEYNNEYSLTMSMTMCITMNMIMSMETISMENNGYTHSGYSIHCRYVTYNSVGFQLFTY